MTPTQTIAFNGKTKFYAPTPFTYLAITEMHGIPGNSVRYPVVYSLHVFNIAIGWVWLRKEKPAPKSSQ